MATVPRLAMTGISRAFPGVQALQNVSFEVRPGEIHALIGENGAGKSTLMNLLAGVHRPDSGTIAIDGDTVAVTSEAVAGHLGIAMVHQEQSLVPRLSIAENIFGSRPPLTRLGSLDTHTMRTQALEVLERLGLHLSPDRRVDSLSLAQAQMVEIAKALVRPLAVLILDEPTASLSPDEGSHLFAVMRRLAADGVAIVYVSHRLAEVFEVCDRVTVLKDGRLVGVRRPADVDVDDLIQLMVGRQLSFEPDLHRAPASAPVVLEVTNLTSPQVEDVSFNLRAGEIVCLAGLVGSGRTELCEAIFGARRIRSGTVAVDGRNLTLRHPGDAVAAGIAMVPEDRKAAGLFLEMDVTQNVMAASVREFATRGLISWLAARATTERFVSMLNIRTPNLSRKVVYLSGGNQQKVLLARWLVESPRVLIVDEPTRGIDVGSKAEIYRILRELAEAGTALLVVSSDMLEVLALAHRILVLREGRLSGELDAADADELSIMRLASPTAND